MLEMARIPANHEKIIPEEWEHLIPSKWMSILSLLSTPLPTIFPTASLVPPAESCVVCKPPRWTEEELKTMKIPSKNWLAELDAAITNKWLKGVRSVQHPTNPGTRFPLWVGNFWTVLAEVVLEQREWRRAQEWVHALPQGPRTHKVQALLGQVPWKATAWILPEEVDRDVTSVGFFAKLLSDGLLRERDIDAFVTHLNIQARRRSPKAPGVLVADLVLSRVLSSHHDASLHKINNSKILLQYAAVFKHNRGAYRVLLFPAHVGGTDDGHWVVFRVDFKKFEYSYGASYAKSVRMVQSPIISLMAGTGNSLGYVSYKNDVNKICNGLDHWTRILFHVRFKNIGSVMPIGIQEDTVSCGVCVLNALEHAVLNTRLFTQNHRNNLRVQYFTDIVGLLSDHVSMIQHFPR